MTKKELKKLFDKELNNIMVSDELKEKTVKQINNKKGQKVFYIPYLRNVCAIFIVSFICFSVYYTNNKFFTNKEANTNHTSSITENIKARTSRDKNTIDMYSIDNFNYNYNVEENVVNNSVESFSMPQQTKLKSTQVLMDLSEGMTEKVESMAENEMLFGNVMNKEVINEGILEEEFLLRYPEAIKIYNGYKILENGIEEIYIFRDGILVKSLN